jgi:hypothetical protein
MPSPGCVAIRRTVAERCRLLAGSVGRERIPARPDPDDADWYLPLHLREERAARERIAAQVLRGADVVVAPTWLTHRRALLPLGETRRAAAWTAAAVRVAREAVEVGLERRAEAEAATQARLAATDAADEPVPDDVAAHDRPRPLVAASLPALDDEPEADSGRLLPAEAATERDYRAQAGVLADAEPDLILVEGQRSEAAARVAATEAVDTGLPAWQALTPAALASTDLEGWLDWARRAGVERLLLPPPLSARLAAAVGELPWGGLVSDPATVSDWLAAGASVVGVLDRATPQAVEARRRAIDDHERGMLEAALAAERRWLAHVERAATMAPGGAAVWIGSPPDAPLPAGFEWLVVDVDESRRLPEDRFRLVVVPQAAVLDPRILERGGIVAMPYDETVGQLPALDLLAADDDSEPPLLIARRAG